MTSHVDLLHACAACCPQVLEHVAAQSAVVLLPVLELASRPEGKAAKSSTAAAADVLAYGASLEVDAAAVQLAADVLHEIVVKQRHHVRPALQAMPPLPSLEVLQEVNAVLAQVCSGTTASIACMDGPGGLRL
jgi:hypothetical protein